MVNTFVRFGVMAVAMVLSRFVDTSNPETLMRVRIAYVVSVVLNATVSPDTATDKSLDWSVKFADPASEWANGKTVTDYVTVTPQADGSSIATIQCLQPFGEQIIITAASRQTPAAKAVCSVDFYARIIAAHQICIW